MGDTYEEGQTVYLIDGEMAEYVSAVGGQHIIRPMILGYDDEPYAAQGLLQVPEVFRKPPVAAMDAKVAEAKAELDRLNTAATEARRSLHAAQSEERQMMDRLRQYPALKNVDLWLQGKITHAVYVRGAVIKVRTMDQFFKDEERYDASITLISIEGRANKDAGFRCSGRATQTDVSLFANEEEARAFAAESVEKAFAAWRKDTGGYRNAGPIIESATALDLPVPADAANAANEVLRKRLADFAAKAERELATYRAQIAALPAPEGVS